MRTPSFAPFRAWHCPTRLLSLICTMLAAACLLAGCQNTQPVRQESFVFGTRVEVVALGPSEEQTRAALSEVLREFDRLHRTFHAWQASDLTTLNATLARGDKAQVSDEMLSLLQAAQRYAAQGDYLFDPAIGHLIELWGFHTDNFQARLPDPAALSKIRQEHASIADLDIAGHLVSSRNRAVALDFGGIAKGYALDRARAILQQRGIHNALINIGGNIMALGSKGDQPWTVGIQNPRQAGAMATLALYDGEAIGTSGDYQRFFDLGGTRYCHLIDPRTGEPAHHTQAVTILATASDHAGLISDVTSKPIFLAHQGWRAMASKMGVGHVLRVDASGRIEVTQAMRARLRWSDGIQADQVVP